MTAVDLAKFLNPRRNQIAGWKVLVADVADLDQNPLTAYRIGSIELDEPQKEIRITIEYPDKPKANDSAMTAGQFLDCLLPLASDNPDFALEASIKISLTIQGERWERYGMPLREIVGCEDPRLVLLGVEGLNDFGHKWPGIAQ